jgi:hypothetical protein
MTFGQVLDMIRAEYLKSFRATVQTLKARACSGVLTEVVLRDSEGHPVREGVLLLPMRIDALVAVGGQACERIDIGTDSMLSFERIAFNWNGNLEVIVSPFSWDNVTLRSPRFTQERGWGPLQTWFHRWFRADDDGAGEPIGVIHFLADPTYRRTDITFTADLGSAPVEAFEELLDAFSNLGVPSVTIDGGPEILSI